MIALNAAVTKELHDIITTLIITSTACEDEVMCMAQLFFGGNALPHSLKEAYRRLNILAIVKKVGAVSNHEKIEGRIHHFRFGLFDANWYFEKHSGVEGGERGVITHYLLRGHLGNPRLTRFLMSAGISGTTRILPTAARQCLSTISSSERRSEHHQAPFLIRYGTTRRPGTGSAARKTRSGIFCVMVPQLAFRRTPCSTAHSIFLKTRN